MLWARDRVITPPNRVKALAASRLQETHDAHVAVAETKQQQEKDGTPHVHADGISDGEDEIDGEAQFEQRQPTVAALVLLALPRFIVGLLDAVFRRAYKFRLDANQRFQHRARVGKCQA